MQVFVLMTGCVYEGGGPRSVHATRESGLAAVQLRLDKKEADRQGRIASDKKDVEAGVVDPEVITEWPPFTRSSVDHEDYWSDGLDYIYLKPFDVEE